MPRQLPKGLAPYLPLISHSTICQQDTKQDTKLRPPLLAAVDGLADVDVLQLTTEPVVSFVAMNLLRLAAVASQYNVAGTAQHMIRSLLGAQKAVAGLPFSSNSTKKYSSGSKCSPEELAEFRENVATFAKTSIAIHAEEVDKTNNFPKTVDLWRGMGDFGLLGKAHACGGICNNSGAPTKSSIFTGVTAPEEYGGLDMGYQAHCIAMEVSILRDMHIALTGARLQLCTIACCISHPSNSCTESAQQANVS